VIHKIRDVAWHIFLQEVEYREFGYRIMSSKVIGPSFKLVVVDGSITISVRSVLAETGTFPRLGSEVLNFRWMLYTRRSWFACGPHECMKKL
jgi:hypothetical protein